MLRFINQFSSVYDYTNTQNNNKKMTLNAHIKYLTDNSDSAPKSSCSLIHREHKFEPYYSAGGVYRYLVYVSQSLPLILIIFILQCRVELILRKMHR